MGASLHAAPRFPRTLFLISWISPPGVSLQCLLQVDSEVAGRGFGGMSAPGHSRAGWGGALPMCASCLVAEAARWWDSGPPGEAGVLPSDCTACRVTALVCTGRSVGARCRPRQPRAVCPGAWGPRGQVSCSWAPPGPGLRRGCAGTWAAETTGEGGRAKCGQSGPHAGDRNRASYLWGARYLRAQDVLKSSRWWCPHAAARIGSL